MLYKMLHGLVRGAFSLGVAFPPLTTVYHPILYLFPPVVQQADQIVLTANRPVISHGLTRLRLQKRLSNVPHRYHTRNLVDRPSLYSVIGYIFLILYEMIL